MHMMGVSDLALIRAIFNEDEFLDIVLMYLHDIGHYNNTWVTVLAGNGNNSFSIQGRSNDGCPTRSAALGEFTGDNHLDYAVASNELNFDGIKIFAGDDYFRFDLSKSIPTDKKALSVNSADFNADGYDDLAIGTVDGIQIYLADGMGDFTKVHSYDQVYGSLDIEVTNKGSDFDNNDIFDLCISTPSVGGRFSDMMVYLGNGDGSFEQNCIRTAKGQIFGNCIGDFNNDNELDIAYVNGAKRYAAILFGEGDGDFVDELRFSIPHTNPQFIDCFDIDLDGDLDMVVAANDMYGGNSLYSLMNQLNPGGFAAKSFKITACDNAEIELVSPSGKVFNRIRNTMPSGEYHKCDINHNDFMDDFASLSVVESGEYVLNATPKPNLSEGKPFTLEFMLDGQFHRLAKDVPMKTDGYRFNIYADGRSEVTPSPGSLNGSDRPGFEWPGSGNFNFQLATDIDFSNILVEAEIEGNSYDIPTALPVNDTTTFYWRVKNLEDPDYKCLYVVNILLGYTNAEENEDVDDLPEDFHLANNYPNPFNPSTTIEYSIPTQSHVTISIYNLLGQKIRTLVDETQVPGKHITSWNGRDYDGKLVASGVYFYKIIAGDYAQIKKMLLQK